MSEEETIEERLELLAKSILYLIESMEISRKVHMESYKITKDSLELISKRLDLLSDKIKHLEAEIYGADFMEDGSIPEETMRDIVKFAFLN